MSNKLKQNIGRICHKLRINGFIYSLVKNISSKESIKYDALKCEEELESFSKEPIGSAITNNRINYPVYDLQIVVATYNNKDSIKKCLDSIDSQITSYKYICYVVNDGSNDGTSNILNAYLENNKFKIIHKENGGAASARNVGIKNIEAEYVMFVDADDYLPNNSINDLLSVAYSNNADIVEGSMKHIDNKHNYLDMLDDCVINDEKLRGYVCGKVFKSKLFENICFPEGFWFEDTVLSFIVNPSANLIMTTSKNVYCHNVNRNGSSIGVYGKNKCIDTYWITKSLDEDRMILNYNDDNKYLNRLKKQFLMNYRRVYLLPDYIKKNIFCLERELIINKNIVIEDEFLMYIINNDYNAYNLYAFWN